MLPHLNVSISRQAHYICSELISKSVCGGCACDLQESGEFFVKCNAACYERRGRHRTWSLTGEQLVASNDSCSAVIPAPSHLAALPIWPLRSTTSFLGIHAGLSGRFEMVPI